MMYNSVRRCVGIKSKGQEKAVISVEVDGKTARALEHIARFYGCTAEELVENYIKKEMDKLPPVPGDLPS